MTEEHTDNPTMDGTDRLLVYATYKEAKACLFAKWLKADIAQSWNIGSELTGQHYDTIVIMPFNFPLYPSYLDLSKTEQAELFYFLIEYLPTRLKPGGRIIDLNELTGDLNGQTEPNSGD